MSSSFGEPKKNIWDDDQQPQTAQQGKFCDSSAFTTFAALLLNLTCAFALFLDIHSSILAIETQDEWNTVMQQQGDDKLVREQDSLLLLATFALL